LTDDQTYGTVKYMTNTVSSLADKGVTFTNGFVSDSSCCETRASLLRGQYQQNYKTKELSQKAITAPWFKKLELEKVTLATELKKKGYRTALIGKYLNGYSQIKDHVPPGWDIWNALAWPKITKKVRMTKKFRYFKYYLNENGKVNFYGDKEKDYQTDVLAQKAMDFLKSSSKDNKPFFLYLTPFAPHGPKIPAKRHRKSLRSTKAPRPMSFNEKDISDKPSWIKNAISLKKQHINYIDREYKKQLQTLLSVDEMISKIINYLEKTDQIDNTYIFFLSDNGLSYGEHRRLWGKFTAYEEHIRVPFIVRGPGIGKGKKSHHFALEIDLFPTIAEITGINAPDFIDGRSLLPILKKPNDSSINWRNTFLIQHWWQGVKNKKQTYLNPFYPPHPTKYIGFRSRKYKYVHYIIDNEHELYNLEKDPYELENIYHKINLKSKKELFNYLTKLSKCKGKECRDLENPELSLALQ
ncbi:MAG: sulfatase, partial [Spirochaetota bacterium]|nr:sulfatase [Spirochaetota bacterium]